MSNEKLPCEPILALDLPSSQEAKDILTKLNQEFRWVKIGLQLFTQYGPDIVHLVADMGYKIFLDLKLHDIPNTVASAIKSLKHLPIEMLTIHTSGGQEMMQWAKAAQEEINPNLQLLGVTVLTSMNQEALQQTGVMHPVEQQVEKLAKLAATSGINGLVCSPLELSALRNALGDAITLVTPGIRPHNAEANEQKRIMTPSEAAEQGASYIVIGRPVYAAKDPLQAAKAVLQELQHTSLTHV